MFFSSEDRRSIHFPSVSKEHSLFWLSLALFWMIFITYPRLQRSYKILKWKEASQFLQKGIKLRTDQPMRSEGTGIRGGLKILLTGRNPSNSVPLCIYAWGILKRSLVALYSKCNAKNLVKLSSKINT